MTTATKTATIRSTIYTGNCVDDPSEITSEQWDALAEMTEAALSAAYPCAEVEVEIKHASGYGSGTTIDGERSEDAKAIAERAWQSWLETLGGADPTDEEPTPRTITATAEGYSVALDTETRTVTICRESGEWAGDGRWEDGRIVDCAARLGDDPDESERIYEALEDALGDELDEAERLAAGRTADEEDDEPKYIVVQAAACDGGLMVARLASGETEDQCARRCGAIVRSYGPEDENGASSRNYTRAEAFAALRRIEAEDVKYEARREAEYAPSDDDYAHLAPYDQGDDE
jgi:hypothetical protein